MTDVAGQWMRLHPFSKEKTWVSAEFVQQLKAEMMEAAEEVGLPNGRWQPDGQKPTRNVTTSTPPGSSARPASSTPGPSAPPPTSPPEHARKARGAGLSTGCSEKNKLIETRWKLRTREPSAHAVDAACHFAENDARISEAQAAFKSHQMQAINGHHEDLDGELNLVGVDLEEIAQGFALRDGSAWIGTNDPAGRAKEIDEEIDGQVAAITDLHDQHGAPCCGHALPASGTTC